MFTRRLLEVPALHPQAPDLRVNADRITAHLAALGEFGNPEGGVSRVAYSEADKAARAQVME